MTVDLAKLRQNISREDRRAVTEAEVLQLLADGGFARDGDSWVVNEQSLGMLDPSEVLTVTPIDVRPSSS